MSLEFTKTVKVAAVAVWVLGAGATGFAEEEPEGGTVPQAYPVERYEELWRNSLFGEGRGPAPLATAAPSNLSLVGVFEVDGVEHAVIMDTATGATEEISKTSTGGSRLAKIEASPDLMKTRVQVDRGGSLIWVGYNRGATTMTYARQAKEERLRLLQEKQRQGLGEEVIGETVSEGGSEGGQSEVKAERPRVVVLPSTIPVTARPE